MLRSTMDSQRKRSTLQRLSAAWAMNDNHDAPVPRRCWAMVFGSHAVHDVLVDVDPERVRDDARDPWTAEPRVARLEFDDGPDECLVWAFRSRLVRARPR